MNLGICYKKILVLLGVTPFFLTAMDMPYPQLQLEKAQQKEIFSGQLMIDHGKNHHFTYRRFLPVEYFTENAPEKGHFGKKFNRPSNMPFVHVIMKTNFIVPEVFTIMPADKLLNMSSRSQIDFEMNHRTFRLTCINNPDLFIKPKHFPSDIIKNRTEQIKNTFEMQFLSCMNQFYAKQKYSNDKPCLKELISNNILTKSTQYMPLIGNMLFVIGLKKDAYSHGPQGCSSPDRLIALATNPTTKNNGYSAFNHVMNRQHTSKLSPKAPQTNPAEISRVKCYYSYLENVKHVGNKSPLPKTVHAYKSPALDSENINPLQAEETPDQLALNTILEDCLIECATQEKRDNEALNDIIESCLTDFIVQGVEVPMKNNSPHHGNDDLLIQQNGEYGRHEQCVLL